MSTVNKQSVREEVDRIKLEFERLSRDKKMTLEVKILFQSMLAMMNLILSIFLERTTKKNNKNSSKPSSQTEKDESSLAQKGTHGKGKEEHNTLANNTRTVQTVSVVEVLTCDVCGEDLTKTKCQHFERRTKIDIVFEKVVEHVDAEVKQCLTCDSIVKGSFPRDMPGPVQYGNGLKAYVINLNDSSKSCSEIGNNSHWRSYLPSQSFKVCFASARSFRIMGNSNDRTDACPACHPRRRNFFKGRQEKSMDPCIFSRRSNP